MVPVIRHIEMGVNMHLYLVYLPGLDASEVSLKIVVSGQRGYKPMVEDGLSRFHI